MGRRSATDKFLLFVPFKIPETFTERATLGAWRYASRGRVALYHCLKALRVGTLAIPTYICDSVLEAVRSAGVHPVFYDVDERDLNADVGSVRRLLQRRTPDAVLVASMYGNAAALDEMESLCEAAGVHLIDDAAQSFGASLNGRPVGSFGSAGFFSLSPGKPVPGFSGAFFRAGNSYDVSYSRAFVRHGIRYLDYRFNRLDAYRYGHMKVFGALRRMSALSYSLSNVQTEGICGFEKRYAERAVAYNERVAQPLRSRIYEEFAAAISSAERLRIVRSIRGVPNSHKIVLIFDTAGDARRTQRGLSTAEVTTLPGYEPLCADESACPTMNRLRDRILELPLELDIAKMSRLAEIFMGVNRMVLSQ